MSMAGWTRMAARVATVGLLLAAPAFIPQPAHAQAKPAAPAAADEEARAAAVPDESAGISIPEKLDPRVIVLIEQRRAELVAEEDRIARQREELGKLRAEVEARIDELKKVQVVLEDLVKTEQTQRANRLAQLAEVLAKMRPASAAAVVARMDDQMAVDVLSRMPPRPAGGVMAGLNPEQAARIGELMTRNKEAQQAAKVAEKAASQGAQPPPQPPAPATPPKR